MTNEIYGNVITKREKQYISLLKANHLKNNHGYGNIWHIFQVTPKGCDDTLLTFAQFLYFTANTAQSSLYDKSV